MTVSKNDIGFEDADLLFVKSVRLLEQIKLVCGGQTLYSTLRKRKVLRNFLEVYVRQHHALLLDDLEENIANLSS